MEKQNAAGDSPGPRRRPLLAVSATRVERLTPRVAGVTFTGDALASFEAPRPGAHMKLFFPPSGWQPPEPGREAEAKRPPSRTYTPLRWNPARRELDVEFVLHGDGLASCWAERAKPGSSLYVAGPGGGFDVPALPAHLVLVADDTAMPAAGTILEALSPQHTATLICAVRDDMEERAFARTPHTPQWLHFGKKPGSAGVLLERAVLDMAERHADSHWWIACEAGAMRRIRKHLLGERRIDPARVHTRGYWKLGETNYPDHDYGKDA
ncbi:MAG: siderophore-interacting protein [Gemmatimonadaceae bacterium]|nr:siderophore-interacting protein [Gemmatimonadaceae bacterium]